MQDVTTACWDDVRIFLAVRRSGSLGQAAARLGVNTSTVSRRLSALESWLGARLFDRTREGLVPTRAAAFVLPPAEAMEAAHGRLVRDASGVDADAEGVVRVSAAPSFAQDFVALALVRLRARHPRICVEIDASPQVLDLTRREADIALRSVRPRGAELVMTKLLTATWTAVTSPALADALGRISSWNAAPWITWDRDMATLPAARWLARHARAADLVLRTSHFASQLAAAGSGLGVVLAPEPHGRAHGLVPVRFARALTATTAEWPSDDLWLVSHRAIRDVPRVAAVWGFLLEELRGGRDRERTRAPASGTMA